MLGERKKTNVRDVADELWIPLEGKATGIWREDDVVKKETHGLNVGRTPI